ncbi:MAG: TetR/AcrR family transcriptional regulator [Sneathiellaceae bacterium]
MPGLQQRRPRTAGPSGGPEPDDAKRAAGGRKTASDRGAGRAAPRGAGRPKARKTQAERSAETQRRILEASVRLIRERGYANFRTAEVARLAGVSRGAQLHHYPTKEDLVYATLQYLYANSLARTMQQVSRPRTGEDVLEGIIEDAKAFFFQADFFISLDVGMATPDAVFRDRTRQMAKESRLPAERAWLEVLMRAGIPPQMADDILWLTLSIVRGLAVRMLWQDEPERFERLFRIWREMATEYIAARLPPQAAPV